MANQEDKIPLAGRDAEGKFTEGNIWAYVKKNVGRKPAYKSGEELLQKGLEFFDWSQQTRKGRHTLAALRLWIGLTDKRTWKKYSQDPEFRYPILVLEAILEDHYEQKLQWAGSAHGAFLWLKNKAGYTDDSSQTIDVKDLKAKFTLEEEE